MEVYSNVEGVEPQTITVTDNMGTSGMTAGEAVTSIASTVGLIAGLVYAHKQKSHFWGYVGFGLLGSVVFGAVGRIGQVIIEVKK